MINHIQSSASDCFRTTVACILDVQIEDIPKLHLDYQLQELNIWLRPLGLYYFEVEKPIDNDFPDWVTTILIGKSPRGSFNHCVVGRGLTPVWDVHPDHNYLESISRVGIFVKTFGNKRLNETVKKEKGEE